MSVDPDQGVLGRTITGATMLLGRLLSVVLPGALAAAIALAALGMGAQVEGLPSTAAFALAHPTRALIIVLGSIALVEVGRRRVTP